MRARQQVVLRIDIETLLVLGWSYIHGCHEVVLLSLLLMCIISRASI